MTPGPGIARTSLPKGFYASGVNCGVRKYRPDLGLIISDTDAVMAGVFTKNSVKAAPIHYSQGILPSPYMRAVITNSGQANACTGEEGRESNLKMVMNVAKVLGCRPHQVASASTGVIGVPLDLDKILPAISELSDRVSDSAESFSLAIMTTDLIPKTATTTVKLSGGVVRITGIAKGSGMIHPNMGTMLGYILTDAVVELDKAQVWLKEITDLSFNRISVDGETSTNDCVFLMANGASNVAVTGVGAILEDEKLFKKALLDIAVVLAKSIARDGEGATKLIEVQVKGAPTAEMAEKLARTVTYSPLIKSAVHGEDPNWGRIVARIGALEVPESVIEKLQMSLQKIPLFKNGSPLVFDRFEVRGLLRSDTVEIKLDFNSGDHQAIAWGCDLSAKYVAINTEYST